uniref:SET domain-containing protein n=1 Tax=Syphacia muris TaxID=451379 RepID=A0A0N5AQB6_9BILA
MEEDAFNELNEEESKRRRKRRRPHTKGYRMFLKNEIEKALCAQSSSVSQLFSTDSDGCSSANLNELIILLQLDTEQYHRLSTYALKSISNISTIFRIDGGSTCESLRIFWKRENNADDAAVVYLDNLPKNCRVLYLVQRASMFGTVVSIRARFFGDKRSKLYYTFATDNTPLASTNNNSLLTERRVESAFIRFVDPTSAEKFCKAYKHNVPGKYCSPNKQKKFFTKRKKSVQRAIAFQKSFCNRSSTTSINDSVKSMNSLETSCESENKKDDNDENLASSSFLDEQRGLKRHAGTTSGSAKRVCLESSLTADIECKNESDKHYSRLSIETVDEFPSASDEVQGSETSSSSKQVTLSQKVLSIADVNEAAKSKNATPTAKRKRHRKKNYGQKKRAILRRRCKVHHVTRYFSKMQVLPLATFKSLRDEYMSMKRASIAELKKKLKLEKIPLKTVAIGRSRFKKMRGRCKVLLRAAALRDRIDPISATDA